MRRSATASIAIYGRARDCRYLAFFCKGRLSSFCLWSLDPSGMLPDWEDHKREHVLNIRSTSNRASACKSTFSVGRLRGHFCAKPL